MVELKQGHTLLQHHRHVAGQLVLLLPKTGRVTREPVAEMEPAQQGLVDFLRKQGKIATIVLLIVDCHACMVVVQSGVGQESLGHVLMSG